MRCYHCQPLVYDGPTNEQCAASLYARLVELDKVWRRDPSYRNMLQAWLIVVKLRYPKTYLSEIDRAHFERMRAELYAAGPTCDGWCNNCGFDCDGNCW
jgi:hypothetical protein